MFDLLCLTDRTLCREPFLDRVAAIAAARPAALILREKDLPEDQYQALAAQVMSLCRQAGVPCILLVVLGIIFYVVMAQSRQRLDALSTRNEQLQQQYAALDQKNRDLREELTYVATDAYIEETARNEFGYVRDGEIHFHFASMDVLRGYTEAEWNALLDEFRD